MPVAGAPILTAEAVEIRLCSLLVCAMLFSWKKRLAMLQGGGRRDYREDFAYSRRKQITRLRRNSRADATPIAVA